MTERGQLTESGPLDRAASPRARGPAGAAVAVVGAGISGLACARALAARGVVATIFEKSRGVGGRAATRRVDTEHGPLRFDHGAQYFTARGPAFAAEVDALAAGGLVAPWEGRIAVLDRGAVRDAGAPGAAPRRWVAVPGMSALGGALAAGVDVRLGTRIVAVHPDGTRWRLESELGDAPGRFDAVVVAAPAPQAAPLLAQAAPPLALAASRAVMTPCWSAMLAVEEPLALPFDGAFVGARAAGTASGDVDGRRVRAPRAGGSPARRGGGRGRARGGDGDDDRPHVRPRPAHGPR